MNLPDTGHHGGAPGRRQRHDLRLHPAPQRHQRGVEEGHRDRHDGELARERQVRGLAQERRRRRDHQADARLDRLHRVRLRQARQARDGAAAEQGGPVRGARRRRAASEALASVKLPDNLRAWLPRSGGRQGLPDRDLHLDALLQEEQGPEEGGRAPRAGRVLLDRRAEDRASRWDTSRCRPTS